MYDELSERKTKNPGGSAHNISDSRLYNEDISTVPPNQHPGRSSKGAQQRGSREAATLKPRPAVGTPPDLSMSVPCLFIPTYGKQTERAPDRTTPRSLPIPSKRASTKSPFNNKRSLMPSLVFNGNIQYIQTFEAAENAGRALEAARPQVLGFDIEWQVSFVSGQAPRPTATLQLCVPENPTQTGAATLGLPHNTLSTAGSICDDDPKLSGSSDQEQRKQKIQQQQQQQQHHHHHHHHHHQHEPRRVSPVWGTAFIFHLCHMRGSPSTLEESPPARPSVPSSASPSTPPSTPPSAPPTVQPRDPKPTCTDRSKISSSSSSSCLSSQKGADSMAQENRDSSPAALTEKFAAYLPDSLVRVLTNPGILLAGVGVGGDVSRLEREYEQLRVGGVNGVVDLSELAKRKVFPDRRRRGMWSLADLCAELLHVQLRKPSSLRTGNWEKRPLHVDQLFYAAADAYAGVRLWQVLSRMPDLVLRRSDMNGLRDDKDAPNPPSDTTAPMTASACNRTAAEERARVVACSNLENKAPASALSMAKLRLPLSKRETHRLWHEDSLSIEEVAEVRCIKTSTVQGYLSDCIEAGLPYDWERLGIDTVKEKKIRSALLMATLMATKGCDSETKQNNRQLQHKDCVATKDAGVRELTPGGNGMVSHGRDTARESPYSSSPEVGTPQAAMLASTAEVRVPAVTTGTKSGGFCDAATRAKAELDEQSVQESSWSWADGGLERLAPCENRGSRSSHERGDRDTSMGSESKGRCGAESVKGRWEAVRLKEVKDSTPDSEYWEIRMVLARLKSGR